MKPNDIAFVDGDWKICKVGAFTDRKTGEYYSALKWYLPKTREDRCRIARFKEAIQTQEPLALGIYVPEA